MVAVFVNGNPESGAVWDLLIERLDRTDVVRLSPPGFGAPIPAGFGCTSGEYGSWLIAELQTFDQPVDLVGHDIGGSIALAVAMTRPELLHSWVSDSAGVFDPEYEWHALAKAWQTPGVGEASVAELLGGTTDDRAARMTAQGMPADIATRVAPAQDAEMGRAILAFYRSATGPVLVEIGRHLEAAAARPGLVVIGTNDHFVGSEGMRRRAADRAGAEVAVLDGVGHWWMAESPADSAEILQRFWSAHR